MSGGWGEGREGLWAVVELSGMPGCIGALNGIKFSVEESGSSVACCHKVVKGPLHHCQWCSRHHQELPTGVREGLQIGHSQ